ncbi:MAG: alpha/beta hydrolase [Firmicutes bacterium HGW-Firmicutes-2]|jgi:pimeloyl-ACP methyl ester carboxylesterase|nr:MAG: alpha/beta hydrolase [Firmicutes bacterium HGW-Firmicutes-2]
MLRKVEIMKKILIYAVIVVVLILFIVVYIQYDKDMHAAYQRVSEGSEKFMTDYGEIEYSVEGEGTPVLLIHGAGGGYDQGLLMGNNILKEGYEFISVSRFGYLGSPMIEDSTVEKQAMMYTQLLDYLNIDKVVVFGVSAGGPSAVQFAHDYPDRSHALILVSAVAKYMGDDVPTSTKIVNSIQKSDFAYWLVLKIFRTQFQTFIGISEDTIESLSSEDKEIVNDMLAYMHPMSPRLPGNLHEAAIKPLAGEELSKITVPTIILHAKDDSLVDYEHAIFYKENIRKAKLVTFDHGGHGMVTELKDMHQEIKAFLEKYL